MAEGSTRTTKSPGRPSYCGGKRISKIYCGATEVIKAYCGENLSFSPASAGTTASYSAISSIAFASLTKTGASITTRQGSGTVGNATTGVIYGGARGGSRYNDFYKYDVTNSNIALTALTRSGATPAVTRYMGMAGDATTGVIFMGEGSASNTAHRYVVAGSAVTLTALTVSGTAPAQAIQSTVGDVNEGLFFGGLTTWPPRLNDFYKYTVSGNNFTTSTLTKTGASIAARYGVSLAGDLTSGIVFGGRRSGGDFNDFYKYDISGSTINITALTKVGVSIPAMYGTGIIGDATNGFLFAGQSGSTQSNNVFNYTVAGSTVTLSSVTKTGSTPSRRSFPRIVGDSSSGMVWGGRSGGTEFNDFYSYTAT